jgi:hypothetical protein
MPGKTFEALAIGHEIAAIAKRATGAELTIAMPIGGNANEIGFISYSENLAQAEERLGKLMADAEYRSAIKKWENAIVPGSARDQLWRGI